MVWTGDSQNHLAKSLLKLYTQVDTKYPIRDKSSDGTIGDTRHQAGHSEHNPDENHLVRALDISYDPGHFDAHSFGEYLRTHPDPRLQYIISNGRIANADIQNWAWRPYHGENPHNHHIHLTVRSSPALAEDDKDWNIAAWDGSKVPGVSVAPAGTLPRLHLGSTSSYVASLREKLKLPPVTSLVFDEALEKEIIYLQFKHHLTPDGWVGPATWGALGFFAQLSANEGHENTRIIATEFGGRGDFNKGAYDGHIITDTEIGASLPFRFAQPTPLLWVRAGGTVEENVPLVDVGPIYPAASRGPADPYWETGARPRAETQHVLSEAGIDLTPALAKRMKIDGKGLVDWGFMKDKKGATTVSDQSENTPRMNEPGYKPSVQPPLPPSDPAIVVKPVQGPDLAPLLGAGISLLLPWLQAKLENKPTPALKDGTTSQLITLALPVLMQFLSQKPGDGTSILTTLLAGVQGAAKSPPVMSSLDKLLGGEALLGKKTAIGAVGTILSIGLQLAGIMPPIGSGATSSILATLLPAGLSVLGLIAKMDRNSGTGSAG